MFYFIPVNTSTIRISTKIKHLCNWSYFLSPKLKCPPFPLHGKSWNFKSGEIYPLMGRPATFFTTQTGFQYFQTTLICPFAVFEIFIGFSWDLVRLICVLLLAFLWVDRGCVGDFWVFYWICG